MSEERTKVRCLPFNKLNVEGGGGSGTNKCFLFLFFIFIYFFFLNLLYSILLFPRIEPVGELYSEVCFHPELWFGMVPQPNSLSKRLGRWIEHVLAYCRDWKKKIM